jgi:hypothetical protein
MASSSSATCDSPGGSTGGSGMASAHGGATIQYVPVSGASGIASSGGKLTRKPSNSGAMTPTRQSASQLAESLDEYACNKRRFSSLYEALRFYATAVNIKPVPVHIDQSYCGLTEGHVIRSSRDQTDDSAGVCSEVVMEDSLKNNNGKTTLQSTDDLLREYIIKTKKRRHRYASVFTFGL